MAIPKAGLFFTTGDGSLGWAIMMTMPDLDLVSFTKTCLSGEARTYGIWKETRDVFSNGRMQNWKN